MDIIAKILLVEADYNLGINTKRLLEANGYEVTLCGDGEVAWETFKKSWFDFCLIEVALKKINGLELAKMIRQVNEAIPIFFVSSRSNDLDVIAGFQHGCDGYLVKPFAMQELLFRMAVFVKRSRPLFANKISIFEIGEIRFEYNELRLTDKNGRVLVPLTQKMSDILKFLCENPNRDLTRSEILMHVWGKDDYFSGRSLDVFITKLRKILSNVNYVKIGTLNARGFIFHLKTPKHNKI